jgi:DNA-binding Lrp family transcriptional regulator
MAVEAYVFIDCEHGKAREVAEKIKKIGGAEDVKTVTGPHDIIAYVAASSFKVLGDVVITKIQAVDGVKRTLTNVVIE